jgi:acyl carrier protein
MSEREQVRAYVGRVLRERNHDGGAFADGESLLFSGRLSSLDVVGVLSFLEQTFDFKMDPYDFDPGKFDSVNNILALLGKVN